MILRWQDESDTVYGDRWIILIAYIIGLSIGVHLLNLLCIPAMYWFSIIRNIERFRLKEQLRRLLYPVCLLYWYFLSTFPEWRILEDGSNYSCQCLGISFPNRTDWLSGYHIFPAHSWYLSFQKTINQYSFMVHTYAYRRLYHLCSDIDSCQCQYTAQWKCSG